MEIKASDVKALRDKTGAGMMDCKKALVEAEGNTAKAEKILKELGLAAAAKRTGRATNEGRIFTHIEGGKAGILEMSCETDFVARNADFIAMGKGILATILTGGLTPDAAPVQAEIQAIISTIKENMAIRRYDVMEAGPDEMIVDYVHGEGGTVGVLVKLKAAQAAALQSDAAKALAFDLALHVAAFAPVYRSESDVDQAYLTEQEEIFTVQAANLGKPANVVAGIVKGKLKKHLSEVVFLNQPFVKEEKKSVQEVITAVGKDLGTTLELVDYRYFRVGDELKG